VLPVRDRHGRAALLARVNAMTEYIVVGDKNSRVLLSTTVWGEAVKFANKVRAAGGGCTIFKSTRG
jgi:hypothetical protein